MSKRVNENFFEKWNDDMAYVLGFLFADGNISKTKRGGYYVAFHSADKELLIAMAEKMVSTHKVAQRSERSGRVYRLQIGSKKIVADLETHGLHETKARRMHFPNVPINNIHSFILGFFDGDGNVWTGYNNRKRKHPSMIVQTAFTSASKEYLNGLKSILLELGLQGGSLVSVKGKFCSRLLFGTNDSLKLYEIMYNRPRTSLGLERKKKVFEKFIQTKKMQL